MEKQKMFRVIIAGGRDFQDYAYLKQTMDRLLVDVAGEIAIVCGEARGADLLGKRYAEERGYVVHSYPADWEKHGKAAGFVRNKEMSKNADALVAFWDGKSSGTKHMIEAANQLGLKMRIKKY